MQHKTIKICLIAALFLLGGNAWATHTQDVPPQDEKTATQPSADETAEEVNNLIEVAIQELEQTINGTKGKEGKEGLKEEYNKVKGIYDTEIRAIKEQLKKRGFTKEWIEKNAAKLNVVYTALEKTTTEQKKKIADLKNMADSLSKETKILEAEIKELKAIRDSVVVATINRHTPLLTKPLSELKDLDKTIDECKRYSDTVVMRNFIAKLDSLQVDKAIYDYTPLLTKPLSEIKNLGKDIAECNRFSHEKRMQDFIAKLNVLQENKRAYDDGLKLLTVKFDSVKIKETKAQIELCKTRVAESQQAELDKLLKDFDTFEEGVNAFYEFIMILNTIRGQSRNFATPDFDHFLNSMKTRRPEWKDRYDRCIMTNSYLKKGFNKFVEQVRKSPQLHPEIEKEILSSATKNKQN